MSKAPPVQQKTGAVAHAYGTLELAAPCQPSRLLRPDLYRWETRAALTDVKISANDIAPYRMKEIKSRSCHTARHKAANGDTESSPNGPDHRPAHPVRLRDHGIIGYVDPFIVYSYAVMAAIGFPIRVQNSETIRI